MKSHLIVCIMIENLLNYLRKKERPKNYQVNNITNTINTNTKLNYICDPIIIFFMTILFSQVVLKIAKHSMHVNVQKR